MPPRCSFLASSLVQLRNSGEAQEDSDCPVAPEWENLFYAKVAEALKKL